MLWWRSFQSSQMIKNVRLLHEEDKTILSQLKVNLHQRIIENTLICDMQIWLKTIEGNVLWKVDLIKMGTKVSLKAFMDYVFQCTFWKTGLISSNSNISVEFVTWNYFKWLWSHAIPKRNSQELTTSIFGETIELNLGFLDMLRELMATFVFTYLGCICFEWLKAFNE
jgi:hypothetical protein